MRVGAGSAPGAGRRGRTVPSHEDVPRPGASAPAADCRPRAGRSPPRSATCRGRGCRVSHVDSHRHVHKLPVVQDALARALTGFGIRRVRTVQDIYLRRPTMSPTYWVGARWGRMLTRRFATTAHFYMPTSAGDTDWHAPLLGVVGRLGSESLAGGRASWRPGGVAGVRARLDARVRGSGPRAGPLPRVVGRRLTADVNWTGDRWPRVGPGSRSGGLREASDEASTPHVGGRGDSHQLEDGGGDVEQVGVQARAGRDTRAGGHEEPVLCMVRVVGAGVVLEGVDTFAAAYRADRAPEEIAEVDDEIGCDSRTCG